MFYFLWIVLSLVVGGIGHNRTSGFWGTFIASLVLSPLIGLVIALASRPVSQVEHERAMRQQAAQVARPFESQTIPEQIAHLKQLLESGAITQAQYEAAIQKITQGN